MDSLFQTIGLIVSSLTVAGIVALIAVGRRILGLPKEMLIVKAALFRLLRSNKLQGVALAKIAECQKSGTNNGGTDIAVSAVSRDQTEIDNFLAKAALGNVDDLFNEE
jgi:hypothetical protein